METAEESYRSCADVEAKIESLKTEIADVKTELADVAARIEEAVKIAAFFYQCIHTLD